MLELGGNEQSDQIVSSTSRALQTHGPNCKNLATPCRDVKEGVCRHNDIHHRDVARRIIDDEYESIEWVSALPNPLIRATAVGTTLLLRCLLLLCFNTKYIPVLIPGTRFMYGYSL